MCSSGEGGGMQEVLKQLRNWRKHGREWLHMSLHEQVSARFSDLRAQLVGNDQILVPATQPLCDYDYDDVDDAGVARTEENPFLTEDEPYLGEDLCIGLDEP